MCLRYEAGDKLIQMTISHFIQHKPADCQTFRVSYQKTSKRPLHPMYPESLDCVYFQCNPVLKYECADTKIVAVYDGARKATRAQ